MEEKVFIKNSKGLKLASIIHYPDRKKQYPAIIILHGFIGYKEEEHLERLAKTLEQNGFAAIRFDVSGSGESEGVFEKDYLMSNYLKDIKSVYDYLRTLKFVDKDKIGVVGHSMGGLLSIIFASMQPEVKVCVSISSPTMIINADWVKAAVGQWEQVGYFLSRTSRNDDVIKVPFSFIVDSHKFSALDYVPKLHCPFLIVIGLADDVVSPEDTRKIFEAANEPKELVEISEAGHDYKKYPVLIKKVNEKVLAFLKKYC